jgi:hypothetical protein
MTSGQGGSPEQPTGRPDEQQGQGGGPGWGPPPGYPPGPPSYPSAPGYAPAPSAGWGSGAPQPVERPVAVQVAVIAFAAALVLGLIGGIFTFTDLDGLVDRTIAQAQAQGADTSEFTHDALRTIFAVVAVVSLVFAGLEAMFIAFAWRGRNWARIVLWVLGGLSIAFGLPGLFAGTSPSSGFVRSLGVIQLLLQVVGVLAFAQRPANEWYRYRRWLRSSGQGR